MLIVSWSPSLLCWVEEQALTCTHLLNVYDPLALQAFTTDLLITSRNFHGNRFTAASVWISSFTESAMSCQPCAQGINGLRVCACVLVCVWRSGISVSLSWDTKENRATSLPLRIDCRGMVLFSFIRLDHVVFCSSVFTRNTPTTTLRNFHDL